MTDEVERGKEKGELKTAVFSIVLSTMLYNIAIGQIFFILPLLLFSMQFGKKKASLLVLIELAIIFALELWMNKPGSEKLAWLHMILVLLIPLTLSASGMAWMWSDRKKTEARVMLAMVPFLIAIGIVAAMLVFDTALRNGLYSMYSDAFSMIFADIMKIIDPNMNVELAFQLVLLTVLSFLLPMVFMVVCANGFVYETMKHSKESSWEDRVSCFELRENYIWCLILSWTLVLASRFISIPLVIQIAVLNVAGFWTSVYSVEGFTVVYARLRRNIQRLRSLTLFMIIFFISMVIPGINIIIILALPLAGALENFFDLKKTGVKNEDHS